MEMLLKTCDLCSGKVISNARSQWKEDRLRQNLWRYLYHENVRETVAAPGILETGSNTDSVKLSFILSMGNQQQHNVNNGEISNKKPVQVCQRCEVELEELERLHKNLEEAKERMDAQIRRINQISRMQGKDNKVKNLIRARNLPKMEMVFAGATMGAENVVQTLEFLSKTCERIGKSNDETNENSDTFQPKIVSQTSLNSDYDHQNSTKTEIEAQNDNPLHLSAPPPDLEIEEIDEQESATEFLQNNLQVELTDDIDDNFELEFSTPIQQKPLTTRTRTRPNILKTESRFVKPLKRPAATQLKLELNSTSSPNLKKNKSVMKQCSICDKIMASNNLAQHMRSHTGERPYRCDNNCGATFSQKSSFNQHMKRCNKNLSSGYSGGVTYQFDPLA